MIPDETTSPSACQSAPHSPALRVIRNFKWTSTDQNFVANLISGKKLSKDKAAAQWVKANGKKVNAWLK